MMLSHTIAGFDSETEAYDYALQENLTNRVGFDILPEENERENYLAEQPIINDDNIHLITIIMKKFTTRVLGLIPFCGSSENELALMFCWNQLVDENKKPSESFKVNDALESHMSKRSDSAPALKNIGSLIEIISDKEYRLTDRAIQLCQDKLN